MEGKINADMQVAIDAMRANGMTVEVSPRLQEEEPVSAEKAMVLQFQERRAKAFEEAVKPLHAFLCQYYHPHATVIVTQGDAEVLEGSIGIPLKCPD